MRTRSEPATDKRALRLRMAEELARIPPAEAAEAAARAGERFLGLPEIRSAESVLVCLSFGAELDTRELVGRLLRSGRRLYAPRAGRGAAGLSVHPYPCELETLSFGLEQPRADAPRLADAAVGAALDAALVAGLAFDRRGYRLGYGKGHFDRFLAGKSFPTVGYGHAVQLLDAVPVEPHDVPLTLVVTDDEVCRPGEPPRSADRA